MKRIFFFELIIVIIICHSGFAGEQVKIWDKFEHLFTSTKTYENPLYDVKSFSVLVTAPSGLIHKINGFWDGELCWKFRFCPDEIGEWTFKTQCSDQRNTGLHNIEGGFTCIENGRPLELYKRGTIVRPKGQYYLTYSDGTPFFFAACTAWNGALRSTDAEWDNYLKDRAESGYNVIQFITTQWRGCEANRLGQVAFEGCGRISINAAFFQFLDQKVDRINDYGLVAAPVLLWALQYGAGRHLSPGYYLPENEAILLAKYLVARYGGNQVIWILGGDGKYVDEYETRWKTIGRGVFGDPHPGVVTNHPMGRSWYGDAYQNEDWLDFIGYQSSHSNKQSTVDWITKGPAAKRWDKIPAKPIINMEPNYEEIHFTISAADVRNASFWSVLAAPPAGITYGANGIWPWLRPGENILNHEDATGTHSWDESIRFPGSRQIGFMANYFRRLE